MQGSLYGKTESERKDAMGVTLSSGLQDCRERRLKIKIFSEFRIAGRNINYLVFETFQRKWNSA
jgi:hypothetical protein